MRAIKWLLLSAAMACLVVAPVGITQIYDEP